MATNCVPDVVDTPYCIYLGSMELKYTICKTKTSSNWGVLSAFVLSFNIQQ